MRFKLILCACLLLLLPSASRADSQVFRSDVEKVSFRYPSHWEPVHSQLKSTLVMLYARDGSLATCNLSVIPSDRSSAMQFDASYFLAVYRQIYKDFTIRRIWNDESFLPARAFVEADFTRKLPSGESFDISTLTMATVYNGKRYMLVLNAPRAALAKLRDDFQLITSTLIFFSH